MQTWRYFIRGGEFGGQSFTTSTEPTPLLWIWVCDDCDRRHVAWDIDEVPEDWMGRAIVYRLEVRTEENHHALYVVGDSAPEPEREIHEARGLPRPRVFADASSWALERMSREEWAGWRDRIADALDVPREYLD